MSDRVAIMNKGRIEQLADPRDDLYRGRQACSRSTSSGCRRGSPAPWSARATARSMSRPMSVRSRRWAILSTVRPSSSPPGRNNCGPLRRPAAMPSPAASTRSCFRDRGRWSKSMPGAAKSLLAELSGRDADPAARRGRDSPGLAGLRDLCFSRGGPAMTDVTLDAPKQTTAVDRERVVAFGFSLPSLCLSWPACSRCRWRCCSASA